MNIETGNIFAITNDQPLAANEVELTANEFAKLFPSRSLDDRLDAFRRMRSEVGIQPDNDCKTTI